MSILTAVPDIKYRTSGFDDAHGSVIVASDKYLISRFISFADYLLCISFCEGHETFDVLLKYDTNNKAYYLVAYKNIKMIISELSGLPEGVVKKESRKAPLNESEANELFHGYMYFAKNAMYRRNHAILGNGDSGAVSIATFDAGTIFLEFDYNSESSPASGLREVSKGVYYYATTSEICYIEKALKILKRSRGDNEVNPTSQP